MTENESAFLNKLRVVYPPDVRMWSFAMSTASMESGFNPLSTDSRSTAFGLFGFLKGIAGDDYEAARAPGEAAERLQFKILYRLMSDYNKRSGLPEDWHLMHARGVGSFADLKRLWVADGDISACSFATKEDPKRRLQLAGYVRSFFLLGGTRTMRQIGYGQVVADYLGVEYKRAVHPLLDPMAVAAVTGDNPWENKFRPQTTWGKGFLKAVNSGKVATDRALLAKCQVLFSNLVAYVAAG